MVQCPICVDHLVVRALLSTGPQTERLTKLAPVLLMQLYLVFLRSGLDPFPGGVALRVGHPLHLLETGDCVAHVSRIMDGLFPFLGKSEVFIGDMIAASFKDFGNAYLPESRWPIYPRHRRNAATPSTDSSKAASSINVTVAPVCLAFVTSRSGRDACRGSSLVVTPSASGISGARMACTSSVWGWLSSSAPLMSNSSTCPLARASSVSCGPAPANPRARYCCISRSTFSAVVLASCSCSLARVAVSTSWSEAWISSRITSTMETISWGSCS